MVPNFRQNAANGSSRATIGEGSYVEVGGQTLQFHGALMKAIKNGLQATHRRIQQLMLSPNMTVNI